jgi:hypothetical protein
MGYYDQPPSLSRGSVGRRLTRWLLRLVLRIVFFLLLGGIIVGFWLDLRDGGIFAPVSHETSETLHWVGIGLGTLSVVLIVVFFVALMLVVLGGGIFVFGIGMRKLNEARSSNQNEKGFYNVREFDSTPWFLKIFGFKWISFIDLNRMVPPAGQVRMSPLGGMSTSGENFDASKKQQRRVNDQMAKVRQIAAGKRNEGKFEVMERAGMLDSGRRQNTESPPPLPAPVPVEILTLSDALNRSTVEQLILGQADNGKICTVNLRSSVHIGIYGASGCGKTESTGFQLVLAAIKSGYQTVILDGKGGMDWSSFQAVAEWHETDAHVFHYQMAAIYAEYERRMTIARTSQVPHVKELRRPDLQPLLVVIEEIGAVFSRMRLRKMSAELSEIGDWIDVIATNGRAADVHLALITQHPKELGDQVLMSTKAKIIYKFGPGQGNSVGDWHAERLPDTGRFRYNLEEYNPWWVKPKVEKLLTVLPPHRFPLLISAGAHDTTRSQGSQGSQGGGSTSGNTPTPSPVNEPVNEPELEIPLADEPDGSEATDIQIAAQKWIADQLNEGKSARQADMRRYLLGTFGQCSKGYASRLWNSYHPESNSTAWPYLGNLYLITDDVSWEDLTVEKESDKNVFGQDVIELDATNPNDVEQIQELIDLLNQERTKKNPGYKIN